MGKEYIDRGVIVHILMNIPNTAKQTFDVVCNAPAADVAPVVHGYWEYHDCVSTGEGIASVYACSNCHGCVKEDVFEMDEFHKNFCGNCGAKMDGGDNHGR